jgi:heptosyltransferase III
LFFSRGFAETAAALRQRRFPMVFNHHGGPRSALLTAASGATARVGWEGFQYAFVYNVRVPDAAEFYGTPIVHTVEHRISQFYWTGLPRGPIPPARVFRQPDAAERVQKMLGEHGVSGAGATYVVLQPEARLAAMRWPAEKFAEIARWLQQTHGIPSVVNLAGSNGPATSEMRSKLGKVAIVPESLGLRELIALISGATLFIGNDSGPAHLAAAGGTPALVIYGPTSPVQWRPWRAEHRVVTTGAQFRAIRGDKTMALNQPRTIASIAVDEIRAACEDLLATGLIDKRRKLLGDSSSIGEARRERI